MITEQPRLHEYADAEIEAYRRCVNRDSYDARIIKVAGERAATSRNLNIFVVSATILGFTREEALERLLTRAQYIELDDRPHPADGDHHPEQ